MKVQILIDNTDSWMWPYMEEVANELHKDGLDISIHSDHEKIEAGDLLFLISCEKKFKDLSLNKLNLVVHESYLPKGKGWSPLTWQVLEGANEIPVTLFEAEDEIDSGRIFLQELIQLQGHELVNELREKQGVVTQNLIRQFISLYPDVQGKEQEGESTFYKKRTPKDSELDLDKSIAEQFNLLRVCDNERYPAYFVKDGVKYIVKIQKEED